ncbi:MarR family winged helix-turn-helix transcriptional regulator, partial [Streptomyces hirsutus]|uniref:MarR family winged helix-turn-helix transcriptional regulator n=1 Tax=Streptomyces hirsutus TaxID=35620 RepID=UPI00340DA2E6
IDPQPTVVVADENAFTAWVAANHPGEVETLVGHVTRVPDPDDRRAHRVELTETGREAITRIREVGARAMQVALSDWSPEELQQLATLFHRMVDDFLAHAAEGEAEPRGATPAGAA